MHRFVYGGPSKGPRHREVLASKACPGRVRRNSPGGKLLKGLLLVLRTDADGSAEALGGCYRDEETGAGGNGLGSGSAEEGAGGATEGDAEHGSGGHFIIAKVEMD